MVSAVMSCFNSLMSKFSQRKPSYCFCDIQVTKVAGPRKVASQGVDTPPGDVGVSSFRAANYNFGGLVTKGTK